MANIKDLFKSAECQPVHSILSAAGELGKKENIQVYVVGGFVRDLIMGKQLNDIDIMTVGEGIPFLKNWHINWDSRKLFLLKSLGQR